MEPTTVDTWITTQLSGLGTLYFDQAPRTAVYPHILASLTTPGTDVRGVGTKIVMNDLLYVVKVVGRESSYAALNSLADAVHAALHGKSGAGVEACVREQTVRYSEYTEVLYHHLGGIYRIWATGAA